MLLVHGDNSNGIIFDRKLKRAKTHIIIHTVINFNRIQASIIIKSSKQKNFCSKSTRSCGIPCNIQIWNAFSRIFLRIEFFTQSERHYIFFMTSKDEDFFLKIQNSVRIPSFYHRVQIFYLIRLKFIKSNLLRWLHHTSCDNYFLRICVRTSPAFIRKFKIPNLLTWKFLFSGIKLSNFISIELDMI